MARGKQNTKNQEHLSKTYFRTPLWNCASASRRGIVLENLVYDFDIPCLLDKGPILVRERTSLNQPLVLQDFTVTHRLCVTMVLRASLNQWFMSDVKAENSEAISQNIATTEECHLTSLMEKGHPIRLAWWADNCESVEGRKKQTTASSYIKSMVEEKDRYSREWSLKIKIGNGKSFVTLCRKVALSKSFKQIISLGL